MTSRLMTRAWAATRAIDRPIAVLALLSFISQVGVSIMLPLLPLYAVQLGATPTQLGLMVSAFSVTTTIGQLSSGFLASRVPARRQMPLGQAVYAAGNFLIATTSAAVPLIAFRAMSGLGGGLTIISERLYIARVADRARLAFTNGVVSAAGSSGSVLGPLFGAILAASDLRIPFVVVGCTATVACVAALVLLPPERDDAEPLADTPVLVPDAAELDPEVVPSIPPASPLRPGARARLMSASPLVRLGLWSLFFNASYGAWITTFAPYSTANLGLPTSAVALFFLPFGLGAILIGPALGRIADRTGRRRMIAVGTMMVATNIVALVLAAPLPLIYASALVAGGGLAASQASWFAMLGAATDGGRRGRSFGLVAALTNPGVILGAIAASSAWSAVGLQLGIAVPGLFLALAAASLALVPRDRPTVDARA